VLRRNLFPVWIGILLLSGMFLMGQVAWPPPCVVVDIPDPWLEYEVKVSLYGHGFTQYDPMDPEQDICLSDLQRITYLRDYCWLPTYIEDLSGLEYCVGLTEISECGLNSELGPIGSLTNLEVLRFIRGTYSDLGPLTGLTDLRELTLSQGEITDISPLAGLTNLEYLNLASNQISDIYPLVQNSGIGEGDEVSLYNNPLNETSCTVYIPQLRDRGVDVSYSWPCP